MNKKVESQDHYNHKDVLRAENIRAKKDCLTFFIVMAIVSAVFIVGLFLSLHFLPDIGSETVESLENDAIDSSSYAFNGWCKEL